MGIISISDLESKIEKNLLLAGMNQESAKKVTEVYMRANYRGVGHHDVDSLFSRVKAMKENRINPRPNIVKIAGFGAIECYDGDNGLGELCSYFITERSIELSEKYGIGLCTIRNSNHFLSAAPYVEMADEKGYFTIIMSKCPGGLSLPGADKNITGNNPFGYATGYDDGKILFDICWAYSSVGKMNQKAQRGESVPEYWGNDIDGNPTTDPNKILESGLFMPIGEHKGFGMALLIEILTSIIGEGAILNQDINETGFRGVYAHTAITIDIKKFMDIENYRDRITQMINILRELYPDIYIPGQRSCKEKEKVINNGYFEIDDKILERLQK